MLAASLLDVRLNRRGRRIAPMVPPATRFWPKVTKTPGCWYWTGARNADGYGIFGAGGRRNLVLAHRWAFAEARGAVPAGLTLDHLCCTRNCVRPAHLEPVTTKENIRRAKARARGAK